MLKYKNAKLEYGLRRPSFDVDALAISTVCCYFEFDLRSPESNRVIIEATEYSLSVISKLFQAKPSCVLHPQVRRSFLASLSFMCVSAF